MPDVKPRYEMREASGLQGVHNQQIDNHNVTII